jgi:hypothetical protein
MTDPNTQNRQSFQAASFHPRSLTPFAAKVIDSALCNAQRGGAALHGGGLLEDAAIYPPESVIKKSEAFSTSESLHTRMKKPGLELGATRSPRQ